MGKSDLGINLAKRCFAWVKAGGKTSILETKNQFVAKDAIFAYKPKYDKAVNSCTSSLLKEDLNKQTAEKIAKYKVKEDIINFGKPLENIILKRRASDPQLLKLPDDMGDLGADASTYVMNITQKARAVNLAKYNPKVAENMKTKPELFVLSEEELISKKVLDKAFAKVPGNALESIEYRGAAIPKNSIVYQNLVNLKKGDVYIEPGYIWTSPNRNYAFGRYADITGGFTPQASIKYHIFIPPKSKMLCVDRLNPETLLKYNSKFKVCNIIKHNNGNLDLFLEYL